MTKEKVLSNPLVYGIPVNKERLIEDQKINIAEQRDIFYHFNLSPPDVSFNITDRPKLWYITKIKFDGAAQARGNMRFLEYNTETGSGANRGTILFMTYDATLMPATSSGFVSVHEDINFNPPLIMDPKDGLLGWQFAMTGWASESGSNSMYFSIFGYESSK